MTCVPTDAAAAPEQPPVAEPEPDIPQPAPSAWRTIHPRGSRRSRRTQAPAAPPPPPEPVPQPTQSWATWQREYSHSIDMLQAAECIKQRTLRSSHLLLSNPSSTSWRRRRAAPGCSDLGPRASPCTGDQFLRTTWLLYDILRSHLLSHDIMLLSSVTLASSHDCLAIYVVQLRTCFCTICALLFTTILMTIFDDIIIYQRWDTLSETSGS